MTGMALVIAKIAAEQGLSVLADSAQWKNRFEIRSESSNRIYVVAQRVSDGTFGCSCPAWRTRRTCKHLRRLVPLLTAPAPVAPARIAR